jgi:hypothetical protein
MIRLATAKRVAGSGIFGEKFSSVQLKVLKLRESLKSISSDEQAKHQVQQIAGHFDCISADSDHPNSFSLSRIHSG